MSATWPGAVSTAANLYTAVNLLQTTLNGTITSGVTTITLTSTTGFPTAGAITIDNEVIFYTGISGANLTGCVRASDGTVAASHNSGVPVGATVVAYHVNALNAEVIAIETDLNARFGFGSTAITVPSAVKMGLGGVAATNDPFEIHSAVSSAFRGNASFYDSTAMAAGVGGQIVLGGQYIAATYTEFASIQAQKANATSANLDTNLIFRNRGNANGMATFLTIDPSQNASFNGTVTVGIGSTGTNNSLAIINGGSGTAAGAQLRFQRNSVLKATIGTYGSIFGGTSDDVAIYSPSNQIVLNTAGTDALIIDATQHALFTNGTVSLPSISFMGDPDTGIFHVGANELGVALGGIQVLDIAPGWLGIVDGAVGRPGLLFQSDPGTGIYRIGASNIGIALGGSKYVDLSTTDVIFSLTSVGSRTALTLRNLDNTNAASNARFTIQTGGTSGGDPFTLYSDGTNTWSTGLDESDSQKYKISSNTTLGTNDALIIDKTSLAVAIHGSTTNDSAAAGFVGEVIESKITTLVAVGTTGIFGDLTSISLTAGTWLITGLIAFSAQGATVGGPWEMGISTSSGTSQTGLVEGINDIQTNVVPTASSDVNMCIPSYYVQLSGTTTHYLKCRSTFSAGTPKYVGRITAVRIR